MSPRRHRWTKNSSTTQVCELCGCWLLGEDRDRNPKPPALAEVFIYQRQGHGEHRHLMTEPPCDGGRPPAWVTP